MLWLVDDRALDRWIPAWMALARTYPRYWDFLDSEMRREHDLSMSRYDVLAQLDLTGGRLGLSDLATRIWLSPSGLSKLLDRMAGSGLIVRESDPSDARSWFAVLTPHGRALVRRARATHHSRLASTFGSALSDRDLAELVRAMQRLRASFEKIDSTVALPEPHRTPHRRRPARRAP
jgi:DNA-binding MarR family transcriptional regulator